MSNSFAKIPDFTSNETQNKKTKYVKIIPGYPIRIRILDEHAFSVVKHFLPKQHISIVCLGEECPICINNKKLALANPDVKYSDVPGVIGKQYRFLVNVLNRTIVKEAPSGGIYYAGSDGKFPLRSDSGEDLSSVAPKQLNTVEILEKGVTLFEQLNAIQDAYRNADGEPIGLVNFDVVLTASGKGKNMITTALPAIQHSDKVTIPDTGLYALDSVSIHLSVPEIWQLLEGTSFQDVIANRKAVKAVDTVTSMASEVEDDIERFFEENLD